MQKEEVVKLFLEKKKLLAPEALQFLENRENLDEFLARNYNNLVLTEKDLLAEESIKIIKNLTQKPKDIYATE